MKRPLRCFMPGKAPLFLSLRGSLTLFTRTQAVLSSIEWMTTAQMNVHAEKIAGFLSAASLISSSGRPKSLLLTVDLRCFNPLGDVEEEDNDDEETRSR